MSETILLPKQRHILNLINQSEGLLREEIQKKIQSSYPSSRATLIRDLNILLKYKLIKLKGRARATKYLSEVLNPLLRRFDVERFVQEDRFLRE